MSLAFLNRKIPPSAQKQTVCRRCPYLPALFLHLSPGICCWPLFPFESQQHAQQNQGSCKLTPSTNTEITICCSGTAFENFFSKKRGFLGWVHSLLGCYCSPSSLFLSRIPCPRFLFSFSYTISPSRPSGTSELDMCTSSHLFRLPLLVPDWLWGRLDFWPDLVLP